MISVVPCFPAAVAYLFVPGGIMSRSCGPGRAPERNSAGASGGGVLRTDNSERVSRTLVDWSGTAASYTAIAKTKSTIVVPTAIVADEPRTAYAMRGPRAPFPTGSSRDRAIKVHHYLEQRYIVEIMTKCRHWGKVFALSCPKSLPVDGRESTGDTGAGSIYSFLLPLDREWFANDEIGQIFTTE